MTLEKFLEEGHKRGFVNDTLHLVPEELVIEGTADMLTDPSLKVVIVERTTDNICATAYWRDKRPEVTIQDGFVSIPA